MRTGSVRERDGLFYGRLRIGEEEALEFRLHYATDRADAEGLVRWIAGLVDRLDEHDRLEYARRIIDRAAKHVSTKAGRENLEKVVTGMCDGSFLSKSATFQEVAERWIDGDLARLYPDHVGEKDSSDDRSRCTRYIFPHVGNVPVAAFGLADAEIVMSHLPAMSATNRRHIAQIISRVLSLAVVPLKLIPHSPIPDHWLPKVAKRKAKGFLFPSEDEQLLRCEAIPVDERLLYGVLAREGARVEEIASSEWWHWDTDRGLFSNDDNKTLDPRFWALRPDTARAMAHWKRVFGPNGTGDRLERPFARMTNRGQLADTFRRRLKQAGITREELFVTLALAAGKSETWVADRTGHKSSEMINRYRRQARQLSERGITYDSLVDLDVAIGFRSEPVTASGDPPPSRTGDGLASEDEVRTGAAVALAIAVTPLGGGTTGRAGDPEPEAPTVYPCGCSRQDVIYGRCTHEPAPALRASTEEQAVSDVGSFVGSTPDSGEVDAVGFAEFMSGIQSVPKEGIEPSREVSRRILNPGKCIEVSRDASKQGPFDTFRSASHHGSHVDPTPSESDHTSSDRPESVADLDDASGVLPTAISEVQISGLDVVAAACFCAHPGPGRAAECCAGVTFLAGEFVECICLCHEARSHAAFVREATDALLGLCDERGIEVVDG